MYCPDLTPWHKQTGKHICSLCPTFAVDEYIDH
jgi:hypothetical protein